MTASFTKASGNGSLIADSANFQLTVFFQLPNRITPIFIENLRVWPNDSSRGVPYRACYASI
jgi:hypothetical protein